MARIKWTTWALIGASTILLFVVGALLAGIVGMKFINNQLTTENTQLKSQNQQLTTQLQAKPTAVPENPSGSLPRGCSQSECLFLLEGSDWPVGIAALKGYYTRVQRTAWGDTKMCDSFVVTGGSPQLTQAFLTLVNGGNTVNSKNGQNQPIINLEIDALSTADRQKILTSTSAHPIELLTFSPLPLGKEVAPCFAFVEILKVNE